MMKKLGFLLIVLSLVTTTTFAQEDETELTNIGIIKLTDLPDQVKKALITKYPTYSSLKALKGKVKGKVAYRIKLEGENMNLVVMMNSEGKIIESDNNPKYQKINK